MGPVCWPDWVSGLELLCLFRYQSETVSVSAFVSEFWDGVLSFQSLYRGRHLFLESP